MCALRRCYSSHSTWPDFAADLQMFICWRWRCNWGFTVGRQRVSLTSDSFALCWRRFWERGRFFSKKGLSLFSVQIAQRWWRSRSPSSIIERQRISNPCFFFHWYFWHYLTATAESWQEMRGEWERERRYEGRDIKRGAHTVQYGSQFTRTPLWNIIKHQMLSLQYTPIILLARIDWNIIILVQS